MALALTAANRADGGEDAGDVTGCTAPTLLIKHREAVSIVQYSLCTPYKEWFRFKK